MERERERQRTEECGERRNIWRGLQFYFRSVRFFYHRNGGSGGFDEGDFEEAEAKRFKKKRNKKKTPKRNYDVDRWRWHECKRIESISTKYARVRFTSRLPLRGSEKKEKRNTHTYISPSSLVGPSNEKVLLISNELFRLICGRAMFRMHSRSRIIYRWRQSECQLTLAIRRNRIGDKLQTSGRKHLFVFHKRNYLLTTSFSVCSGRVQ